MAYSTCQHTREEINVAGRSLFPLSQADPARDSAIEIIANWRSCHSYPLLLVKTTLKKRARKVHSKSLVAQRIKRLSSISLKLEQNQTMRLSQMQDIGGCRAVMEGVAEVSALVRKYEIAKQKRRKTGPVLLKKYDYIQKPKVDGYRSVHLIMSFQSKRLREYNGQKIEIQIRSKLQHAWATAVETSQAFTGKALKSKIKSANATDWLRFFALMSSAIAAREKLPHVPGTPENKDERVNELKELEQKEGIINLLSGWNAAIKHQETTAPNASAFLLELNMTKKVLKIMPFEEYQMASAQLQYLAREKETEKSPEIQVVLVSVDSLTALKRAYPNYYMDTTVFISLIRQELGLLPP
jgi:Region found in RelA / SpoT proteins